MFTTKTNNPLGYFSVLYTLDIYIMSEINIMLRKNDVFNVRRDFCLPYVSVKASSHLLGDAACPPLLLLPPLLRTSSSSVSAQTPSIRRSRYLCFGCQLNHGFPEVQFGVGATHGDVFPAQSHTVTVRKHRCGSGSQISSPHTPQLDSLAEAYFRMIGCLDSRGRDGLQSQSQCRTRPLSSKTRLYYNVILSPYF